MYSIDAWCVSDLDYKRLIDPDENPLNALRPVLNPSNINAVAKVASKIPARDGTFLSSSVVYCAWALKQFWEGSANKKAKVTEPQSHADWMQRYVRKYMYCVRVHNYDVLMPSVVSSV